MATEYPLQFTLEDGVEVTIYKTNGTTYEFELKPKEGLASSFTYVEDGRPRNETTEMLNFDQLNAVRRFWLEQEDMD